MRKILIAMMAVAGMVLASVPVGAVDLSPSACTGLSAEQKEAAGCDVRNDGEALASRIPVVVSAMLWIAGVLAVGMIIYSAVRMTISQGDAAKIEQEKKTITYAVVGLMVTLLAYVIIGFVAGEFTQSDQGAEGDVPVERAKNT